MITLSGVGMRFGAQVLFENVTWQLHPGAHYGLVGANGTGKSTLLRIMAGWLAPESGAISRPNTLRVGMLPQDQARFDRFALLDAVLMGRPRLWEAMREKERLMAHVTIAGTDEGAGRRLAELEAMIADSGGYEAEAHAAALLSGLGLEPERHRRPMAELSGGYRLRVLLAQVLFQEADLLLLDEPTNHLDLPSIAWLESHLRAYPGTFVLVSHDRHFLNAVCTAIADLDYQELRIYPGDYDAFAAAKALAQARKEAEIARLEDKVAETERFIERFRAKASKARQAQSRKKQIGRIELPEIKRSSRRWPSFEFTPERPSGREPLALAGVSKAFRGRPVLTGLNLALERGERVAVIGPNGVGKSTLLKIAAGVLAPDAGTVKLGYEVRLGYFAQEHQDLLKGGATAYDWLMAASPTAGIATVRGTLGRMLFSGEEALKPLRALSGGESARLLLAGLMLRRDNVLVLDEPTNHLDLEGREALMQALKTFPGTLLLVSHDRHFVSAVATRVIALAPGSVEDFAGGYEEYLRKQGTDWLDTATARGLCPGGAEPQDRPPLPLAAQAHQARKERRREEARLRKAVERLEGRVGTLETALAELERRFARPDYFQNTPWPQVRLHQAEREEREAELRAAIAEWEEAARALEALGQA
jgi:ATPase subunit of ABC transporter with duplicated ATPase domains